MGARRGRLSESSTNKPLLAISATDRYTRVFDTLVQQGWVPLKLFTVPFDERLSNHKIVVERAAKTEILVQLSRLEADDLTDLQRRGCDVLVVVSYPWKIPDGQAFLPRAINIHPSLLPHYRGPYPQVRGLLDGQTSWGVTCHKLANRFDVGDIQAQESFAVSADECHETLDLKVQMAARRLSRRVAAHWDRLWAQAWPQGEGSYVGWRTTEERTLDFTRTATQLATQLRAFGRIERLATINEVYVHMRRAAV